MSTTRSKRPSAGKVLATELTAKGEKRRKAFARATMRVLQRHGYKGVSVAAIAEEAGAPVGLFYRYFPNKSEAILSALRSLVQAARPELPTAHDPESFLKRQLAAYRLTLGTLDQQRWVRDFFYSFDRDVQQFAAEFRAIDLQFDRDHAEQALLALGQSPKGYVRLLPLAHTLTAMLDNFAFRYATRLDPLRELERQYGIDAGIVIARLRQRAYLLEDHVSDEVNAAAPAHPLAEFKPPDPKGALGAAPAKRAPKGMKASKTLQKLKSSALRTLNSQAYSDIRISTIEDASGMTRGSIYHYYNEKTDLIADILSDRLQRITRRLGRVAEASGPLDVRLLTRFVNVLFAEYRANPASLRLSYQLSLEDARLREGIFAHRSQWAQVLAGLISRIDGTAAANEGFRVISSYAMLSMLDRTCYDLFVPISEDIRRVYPPLPKVPQFIAVVWFRMITVTDPPEAVRFSAFKGLSWPASATG